MQSIAEFLNAYGEYAAKIFTYPLHPRNRIYVLYLATSALAAYIVYRAARRRGNAEGSFLRFLFPRHVWQHPSAWLDLRYFFFKCNAAEQPDCRKGYQRQTCKTPAAGPARYRG
jgi:hypothetical protein